MRNVAKLLGMGLLLVTVTACGAGANSGAGAGPTGTTPPASTGVSTPAFPVPPSSSVPPPSGPPQGKPTQGVPPGDGTLGEAQVDAKKLPEGYPRTLALGDGGKTLILQAEEGGCRHISARLGEQTPQHVVVLVAVAAAKKGQMCPDYIREISIPLALSAPLGTRTVVLQQG
jgi:hypothetical protein